MTKLYFLKDDEGAIIPTKRKGEVGYDMYMLPTDKRISIMPGETRLLDTGLKAAFSSDYVLLCKETDESGLDGLSIGAGVIESQFRDRIMIPINNTSNSEIVFMPADKDKWFEDYLDEHYFSFGIGGKFIYTQNKAIGKLLLIPIIDAEVEEVSKEEYAKLH